MATSVKYVALVVRCGLPTSTMLATETTTIFQHYGRSVPRAMPPVPGGRGHRRGRSSTHVAAPRSNTQDLPDFFASSFLFVFFKQKLFSRDDRSHLTPMPLFC